MDSSDSNEYKHPTLDEFIAIYGKKLGLMEHMDIYSEKELECPKCGLKIERCMLYCCTHGDCPCTIKKQCGK